MLAAKLRASLKASKRAARGGQQHYELSQREVLMREIATAGVALLLSFAATDSALAQQISLGARGGYNSANIIWDGGIDTINTHWNSSFHVGGLVRLDLDRLFAVQLEAWYTRKGTRADWTEQTGEGEITASYLEIPLLAVLKVPVGSGARITPHLFAGPTVAFELDCRVEGHITDIPIDGDCDDPGFQIARKKTDIGLLFAGGLEIRTGPGAIQLDAMYDLGLKNLNYETEDPELTVKNRAFMASAGYAIAVGGW
jgi:hypothetical protein